MKRLFTLFVITALAVSGYTLNAQTWSAPSLKGSVPVSGTTYYIYNIGSSGFLNRGGYWAAQAVVTSQPRENATVNIIKWTAVNTTGSTWTFQYNNAGTNVSGKYLFAANTDPLNGEVYTDNSTNNTWNVVQTDATNNIYSIQVVNTYAGYIATQYLGSAATTESTNKGIANTVKYNRTGGDAYTQWIFISQADYDLYNAKIQLDRYMNYAKAQGTIDLSSYIATYNADVTVDINTASTNLLTALTRTDVTASIINASFESAIGSEWTNTGGFVRNNSSPNIGWTKNGTNFAEKWVNSSTNLPTGVITQKVSGLTNGVYGLVVSGHAVQQGGSNPLHTGAFITVGGSATEIIAGNDYYVDNVTVSDGTLTIGYSLQGTTACNWTAFDNFRLYRYVTFSTPSLSASVSSLKFDNINKTSSISVTGSNLTSDIAITAPTGITLSGINLVDNGGGNYSIAAANANATTAITATYNETDVVSGTITISATGTGNQQISTSISVKASSNAGCYTPLYPTGNMIADPTFSAATLTDGGFGGWGPTAIDTKNPYCGRGSAYVRGSCWPDGGSLDRALTAANGNALKPNTNYRIRAMIKSQASTGTNFQIEVEGYDGTTSKIYPITNTNGWVLFDETFTTGATVTEKGIYFNSCSSASPAITDTCFIDNYEMYEIPTLNVAGNNATNDMILFTATNQQVVVPVTATMFTNGFNVSSDNPLFSPDVTTLPNTGGSITLTFTGTASATGNLTISQAVSPSAAPMQRIIGATSVTIPMDATLTPTSVNLINASGVRTYATKNQVVSELNLTEDGLVSMTVYGANGVKIAERITNLSVGAHRLTIDKVLGNGVYLVKLTVNGDSITQKIVK
ncbi:MAG: hypothetical protein H6Q19_163 [Bacteroidetes bacterium]|nr:hypothetical protein [Bacteroidota bacterium]